MAKFLRTTGISHKIEEIIINAKEELVIVSPYLKISNNLFERLKEKSEEGVRIDFIYGKSELSSAELTKIKSLQSINLYYYENLHAKCYYNEREMIITSMNLYEFSEKNNREMGVLINKVEDSQIYKDGVKEAKSILNASQEILTGLKKSDETDSNSDNHAGTDESLELEGIQDQLLRALKRRFPNQVFEASGTENLTCQGFFTDNVVLTVEPSVSKWRIDVQLEYSDNTTRARVFDSLASSYRELIESMFPAKTVNWGSQMKRIKIDIYQSQHPKFFRNNTSGVARIVYLLQVIKKELLPLIPQHEVAKHQTARRKMF